MMGKAGGFASCRVRTWKRRHSSDRSRSFPASSGRLAIHHRLLPLLLLLLFLSLSVTHCVCQSSLSAFRHPDNQAQDSLLDHPDLYPETRSRQLSEASGSQTASNYTSKCSPDFADGQDGSAGTDGLAARQEKLESEQGEEDYGRKRYYVPDGAKDMAGVAIPTGGRMKGGCEMEGGHVSSPATTKAWGRVMWTIPQARVMMTGPATASVNVTSSGPSPQRHSCRAGNLQLRAGVGTKLPELRPSRKIIIASILSIIAAALANVGGVGGGGLFVPMFNLLLGFDAKTSVPLSKAMILGGAIVSFLYNKRVHHPIYKDRPVINYDVAVLLQPMLLLGISVGVFCNIIFPSWLVVLMLTILLTYVSRRTFRNGLKKWHNETKEFEVGKQRKYDAKVHDFGPRLREFEFGVEMGNMDTKSKDIMDDGGGVTNEANMLAENADAHDRLLPSPHSSTEVEDVLPKIEFPWKNIWILAAVWVTFLTIQILKSGRFCVGDDYMVTPCGKGYWTITVSQIPLALGLTLLAVRMLSDQQSLPESMKQSATSYMLAEVKSLKQGLAANRHTREAHAGLGRREFCILPCFACLAGILGGLLGIGGGMIISPMLLELGYEPKVTTSTSMFMVLFASSMSVAEYGLLGRIPVDFGVYFAILCAFAAWIGNAALSKVVKRWGRVSVIVFITAAVIFCSSMIMGVFGGLEVLDMYKHGEYMGFNDVCST